MNNITLLQKLREMAGKGLTYSERADLLAVVCFLYFLVFRYFPKCVLVYIRIKGEVGAVKLV